MKSPSELPRLGEAILELIERARLHRSCLTCEHFDEPSEGCGLAGGQRPPALVIAMGCGKYLEAPPF